jgi:FkbM family methyltransferase
MISRAIDKLARLSLIDRNKLAVLFEQDHLRKLLAALKVDCVFDVGANVGQYASMLRHQAKYKGRIISFEPLSREFQELERVSRADQLWDVERAGITANGGAQIFKVMKSSQFSSFSDPTAEDTDMFAAATSIASKTSVDTFTLKSAYDKYHQRHGFRRPFLKLDTQGLDVAILTHSKAVLQQFVGFQSELSVKKIYQNSADFTEAIALYRDLGFEISALVPNNLGHFPTLIEIDCIMIRRQLADQYLRPSRREVAPVRPHRGLAS